jgi:hypothetical protein
MRVSIRWGLGASLALAFAAAAPAVRAADPVPPTTQPSTPKPAPSGIADRLFLSFAQDGAIVPSQWWEGQLEWDDGSKNVPVDALIARAVVAFQPFRNIEVGGRFGFGKTSAAPSLPDGSGATDLDAYAKYVFPNAVEHTDFAAGLLLTVPTGDDTAGLGFNSWGAQAFGAVRHRLENVVIGGHVGVRINENGQFQGVHLEGKTSFELAVNIVAPVSEVVALVGEARLETERFDGMDSPAELLFGVNWKAFGRGMIRGAVGAGLTDATPNFRVLVGYAYTF